MLRDGSTWSVEVALRVGAISLQWTGGDCFATEDFVMEACCAAYSKRKEQKDEFTTAS